MARRYPTSDVMKCLKSRGREKETKLERPGSLSNGYLCCQHALYMIECIASFPCFAHVLMLFHPSGPSPPVNRRRLQSQGWEYFARFHAEVMVALA